MADAAGSYRKLVRLYPDDPRPLTRLGNTLRKTGDADGALATLQRALALVVAQQQSAGSQDPVLRETEVDCHLLLAETLVTLGRMSDATREYAAVVDVADPAHGPVTRKMEICRERAATMLSRV